MNTLLLKTFHSTKGSNLHPFDAPFSHESLLDLGLDFMGFCWGGYNKPYYQIDCELGTICVLDYQDVYMVRGNREDKLCKITTTGKLKQFINLLDIS